MPDSATYNLSLPNKPIDKIITTGLFEDYINCPMKCFLRASQEKEAEDSYTIWLKKQDNSYQQSEVIRLASKFKEKDITINPSVSKKLKNVDWFLAIDLTTQIQNLKTQIQVIERQPPELSGSVAQFIPIRFTFSEKLNRTDKLLIAFDAFILSKTIDIPIELGEIIHGKSQSITKVKTAELKNDVRKIINKISALLSDSSPPELTLNKHCSECEFQERCYKIASEKDDLSLLSGLSDNEKRRLNNKGIFTVTQLSYTFRPRRRSKHHIDKPERYHHSLKALSIRENKIHIVGTPSLKINGTPVFIDVEGIPDRNFYYLIGIYIRTEEGTIQHSLWANNETEENQIWSDFLSILSSIKKPVLIHYGGFETSFIKKMRDRYPETLNDFREIKILESSVNLLSVIYAQIYFPVYTNSLKETAKYFNFSWSDPLSSGLKSIIWRHQWETTQDYMLKEKLIRYNSEDCQALSLLTRNIIQITKQYLNTDQNFKQNIIHTNSLKKNNTQSKWSAFKSPVTGLEEINNAAYWNYQRERIYARAGAKSKQIQKRQEHYQTKKIKYRVEKVVIWEVSPYCPKCNKMGIKKVTTNQRIQEDLIFGKNSIKLRIIKYVFQVYSCPECMFEYGIDQRFLDVRRYGWNLIAFCIYHILGLYIPQMAVKRSLERLYGFKIDSLGRIKEKAANYYTETRENILNRIIQGNLIHVDETQANVRGQLMYVWVLTNLHEVVYIPTENREGEFIQNLLKNFKGVLVSDFYTAYDSVDCPQQKCLIHLMRDINDEILKYPFNEELKKIASEFSNLLQPIVKTIDKRGLKKYFLRKHLKEVDRFCKYLQKTDFKSEIALKFKQRFEKNQNKLFTFLSYDNVPWNNNNAEHAIKAFARIRTTITGVTTKKGLDEYLTLLSICRSCEYQKLDFLDFLRSGEKDLAAYASNKKKGEK